MIRFSLTLPPRYRLEVKLTKSRENLVVEPFIPNMGKIMRARSGNKISRFFRHIFEHKHAKKIIPLYAAAIIGTSAYMPSISTVSAAEQVATPTHIAQPVIKTQSGTRFPVDKISITQKYSFFHPGLDLDGTTGDPIYPFMAGKVETIERAKIGYGMSIVINHGNGITSRYAHLSKFNVKVGQQVDFNTVIGLMGATGHAFGDHLHFEIYEDGKTVNPLTLLPK